MKKKFTNKGFTLIELLVVIAIIGILASVVLASLNSARNRGNDAKVKSQLANARAAAEIYYSSSSTYGSAANCTVNMFADTASGMNAIVTGTTNATCGSNGTAWYMAAPLSTANTSWCVDSTGASKEEAFNNTNSNTSNYACK